MSSCILEKRLYTRGYHVEFVNSPKGASPLSTKTTVGNPSTQNLTPDFAALRQAMPETLCHPERSRGAETSHPKPPTRNTKPDTLDYMQEEPIVMPTAQYALGSLAVGAITYAIPSLITTVSQVTLIFFTLGFLLLLLSLVLAIIALIKFKKEPKIYKGKWMAWVVLAGLTLLITLVTVMSHYGS